MMPLKFPEPQFHLVEDLISGAVRGVTGLDALESFLRLGHIAVLGKSVTQDDEGLCEPVVLAGCLGSEVVDLVFDSVEFGAVEAVLDDQVGGFGAFVGGRILGELFEDAIGFRAAAHAQEGFRTDVVGLTPEVVGGTVVVAHGLCSCDGVLREVVDNAVVLEKNGEQTVVNLDYVIRMREYPRNKKGKRKSVIAD